jgi:hypothetical protein
MHCPFETLRNTLAKCYFWQNWPGVDGTEEDALARIYIDALPIPAGEAVNHSREELEGYRPYILLRDSDVGGGFSMVKIASGGGFTQHGVITVEINQNEDIEISPDHAEVRKRIRVNAGKLVRSGNINQPGLAELAETPGNLALHRVDFAGSARTEEEETAKLGDAQRMWLDVHWGNPQ